ncbi:hypothetical protein [Streptomyces sp. CA-256286]|uniref:hypothetical protein n=1 Tax=Streptomyces sp. CA-256286 TaxID=2801033 RepID=UPI001BB8061A|nr:hypothetical protein [Streptomyces sp. CA-256286]QTA36854.1 hypothetical protein JHY03_70700 [Streptomyces sp. CA-256286]
MKANTPHHGSRAHRSPHGLGQRPYAGGARRDQDVGAGERPPADAGMVPKRIQEAYDAAHQDSARKAG